MFIGCSTIHFTRNQNKNSGYEYTKWHHIVALGLLELSNPVDLKKMCSEEGGWSSVKVDTGFAQGFVGGYSGVLYSPERVEIACLKTN